MNWKWWIASFGIAGLYYVFKHGEFNTFMDGNSEENYNAAVAWIADGSSITETNDSIKALCDIVDDFNDFMENLDDLLWDELKQFDSVTGLYKVPDLIIHIPNGPVLTVITAETVQDFRINNSAQQWHGFSLPILFTSGHWAFRLVEDPRFEFKIPGTDDWNFLDPADNTVKQGKDCTPPQAVYDDSVLYLVAWLQLITLMLHILQSLGLSKLASTWYNRYITKRNMRALIRNTNDIQDQINAISDLISTVSNNSEVLQNNIFTEVNNNSKIDLILGKTGRRLY